MNVELGDFVGGGGAGVFEVNGDVDGLAGFDFGAAEFQIGEGEFGIAEAVAEGIERSAFFVPVALALIVVLRGVVCVVERDLADVAGPGDGEFAAGDGIAEEKIGYGVAALRAGIPGFEDGGNILRGPLDVERPAVEEDKDYGFASGGDGFEEFFFLAREVEGFAGGGFAAHVLCFAEDEDGEIGRVRERDGFGHFGFRLFGRPNWLRLQMKYRVEEGRNHAFDLNAWSVAEFGLRAEFVAKAGENGNGFGEILLEDPGAECVCLRIGEWAEDGDFFVGGFLQG